MCYCPSSKVVVIWKLTTSSTYVLPTLANLVRIGSPSNWPYKCEIPGLPICWGKSGQLTFPPLQESSKRIDLIYRHAWSAGHHVILSMLYGRMNADSGNLCVGMVAEWNAPIFKTWQWANGRGSCTRSRRKSYICKGRCASETNTHAGTEKDQFCS
jgi:hypothetical protein